jgi:hypothetical protein
MSLEELRAAAEAGDPLAQRRLARELELREEHDEALDWLAQAADRGDAPALALLGIRLMLGERAPLDPLNGFDFVRRAADAGNAEACELAAAVIATGLNQPPDFHGALAYLQRAAELGEPRARRQLLLLCRDPDLRRFAASPAPLPDLWRRAAAAVPLREWLTPPEPKVLFHEPLIRTYEGFTPPEACAWLIERARGMIVPARIYDNAKGGLKEDERRSNGVAIFKPPAFDLIIAIMRARISAASRLPPPALEGFTILHYEPGQRFTRHHDFMNPDVPGQAASLAEHGQRVATFLCYLNDDFDEGQTRFPMLDWSYRGGVGDAILFLNVDRFGAPEMRSLHEGLPTTRGRKWLLSQFLRNKPQPYDGYAPLVEE